MPEPESFEKHHKESTLAEVVKWIKTCTGTHKEDNVLYTKNNNTHATAWNTSISGPPEYMLASFTTKLKMRIPLLAKRCHSSDPGQMITP
jgi:hypothetical protein